MHDFRAYILPKLPPPQRGLSATAIAELLVIYSRTNLYIYVTEISFVIK